MLNLTRKKKLSLIALVGGILLTAAVTTNAISTSIGPAKSAEAVYFLKAAETALDDASADSFSRADIDYREVIQQIRKVRLQLQKAL